MTSSMLDISRVNVDKNFKVYFTYNDIKYFPEFPEGPMVELFNGELFMVPSPNPKHQRISLKLAVIISNHLEKTNLGEIFTAPIDVIFSMKNVFIPDLVYISKENKHIISEKNISGVPDFVIEILSSNKTNDLINKKNIYEKFGVKEYWIIDPFDDIILKYILKEGKYLNEEKYSLENEFITINTIDLKVEIEKIFS